MSTKTSMPEPFVIKQVRDELQIAASGTAVLVLFTVIAFIAWGPAARFSFSITTIIAAFLTVGFWLNLHLKKRKLRREQSE
ncbi:hypothetical protein C4556_01695 [Candidatus Parcubacteria bacterium]|nr:MAG: hypothetical protein C4556_01695 [Candidatus Parcubacteria bacterium]